MSYIFKTVPFQHQLTEFNAHGDDTTRAIFWEMGTGKTKLLIDEAAALYEAGEIDALVVVAPSGVHLNWVSDELPAHLPDRVKARTKGMAYSNAKSGTKWQQEAVSTLVRWDGLSILTVSYELFISDAGKRDLWKLIKNRKVLMVLDESSAIKSPSAKRTQSIIKAGQHALFRRLAEGTPVSNGPFDVYSQMRFLDPGFWDAIGFSTFAEYKANFAKFDRRVIRGETMRDYDKNSPTYMQMIPRHFDALICYRRLDELNEILTPVSSRVLKSDVLDLPEKLYSKRRFEMTTQQDKIYQELKNEYKSEVEGKFVSAALAITRLLRLQQITSGYIPADEEDELTRIPGKNPRLEQVSELLDQLQGKAIIWARFTQDIDDIIALAQERGIGYVRYDGKVIESQRAVNKDRFINDPKVRLFISKTSVGGRGLTLTVANTVIYYNNDFKLRERLQSEDRAHRHGQHSVVNYYDIIANGTVDEPTLEALRNKFDIAAEINGDKLREWL